MSEKSIRDRALQHAEWAYNTASSIGTFVPAGEKPDQSKILGVAAVHSRVAETLAQLELADANRDLARSNRELSVSYDALVDEMRCRRGVRDAA